MTLTAVSFNLIASSPTGVLANVAAQEGEGSGLTKYLNIPELVPEVVWRIGSFYITNTMIMSAIVVIVLSALAIWIGRNVKTVPDGKQNFAEWVVELVLGIVEQSVGTRVGRKIFPLIATLFIFIIAANWMEMIPVMETLQWHNSEHPQGVPLLRAPTSDLNLTLAMTAITLIVVQAWGFRAHGIGGHLKEYLNPLNLIDEVGRVISLSIRLFANIFGGSILLGVMFGFSLLVWYSGLPIILPLTFMIFEMFIGFLQALVFALLALAYITLAVAGGHTEEAEPREGTALREESRLDTGAEVQV